MILYSNIALNYVATHSWRLRTKYSHFANLIHFILYLKLKRKLLCKQIVLRFSMQIVIAYYKIQYVMKKQTNLLIEFRNKSFRHKNFKVL